MPWMACVWRRGCVSQRLRGWRKARAQLLSHARMRGEEERIGGCDRTPPALHLDRSYGALRCGEADEGTCLARAAPTTHDEDLLNITVLGEYLRVRGHVKGRDQSEIPTSFGAGHGTRFWHAGRAPAAAYSHRCRAARRRQTACSPDSGSTVSPAQPALAHGHEGLRAPLPCLPCAFADKKRERRVHGPNSFLRISQGAGHQPPPWGVPIRGLNATLNSPCNSEAHTQFGRSRLEVVRA